METKEEVNRVFDEMTAKEIGQYMTEALGYRFEPLAMRRRVFPEGGLQVVTLRSRKTHVGYVYGLFEERDGLWAVRVSTPDGRDIETIGYMRRGCWEPVECDPVYAPQVQAWQWFWRHVDNLPETVIVRTVF